MRLQNAVQTWQLMDLPHKYVRYRYPVHVICETWAHWLRSSRLSHTSSYPLVHQNGRHARKYHGGMQTYIIFMTSLQSLYTQSATLLRIPSPAHFLCGRGERAYYPWSKISSFIPSVWRPPLLTGGYLQLQMWDLWSRRPDVPLNQEYSQRPSLLWNDDSLKSAKIWRFALSYPFSQIHSHITHTVRYLHPGSASFRSIRSVPFRSFLLLVHFSCWYSGNLAEENWWRKLGTSM